MPEGYVKPVAMGTQAFKYMGHFETANRTMHNKSFAVDNQVAIVGGRNIAEAYFQLDTTGPFIDFDMLCAGPIVKDISTAFDTYWNHERAVPMDALYDEKVIEQLEAKKSPLSTAMQASGESIYAKSINTELMRTFFARSLDPNAATAGAISDDPQKLLEEVADDHQIVVTEIVEAFNHCRFSEYKPPFHRHKYRNGRDGGRAKSRGNHERHPRVSHQHPPTGT